MIFIENRFHHTPWKLNIRPAKVFLLLESESFPSECFFSNGHGMVCNGLLSFDMQSPHPSMPGEPWFRSCTSCTKHVPREQEASNSNIVFRGDEEVPKQVLHVFHMIGQDLFFLVLLFGLFSDGLSYSSQT